MADLSTKKDPLQLRNEAPDYVRDTSGADNADAEAAQPSVNADAGMESQGSLGVEKPVVHLDADAVRKADAEGKGFQT